MSKGLEALNNFMYEQGSILEQSMNLVIVKKELKAMEIIQKHKLLNYILKNKKCASMYHLQDEELDLLKEVLS